MTARLIRVSSTATGVRREVRVYLYDDLAQMRTAGGRFNGGDFADCEGMTQVVNSLRVDYDGREHRRVASVIVRLSRTHLQTEVIVHELNHAAVAIYGDSLRGDERARDVLDHCNETLAYLQSDLTAAVLARLANLGHVHAQVTA